MNEMSKIMSLCLLLKLSCHIFIHSEAKAKPVALARFSAAAHVCFGFCLANLIGCD